MILRDLRKEMIDTLTPQYGQREAVAIVGELWMWLKGWDATELIVRADTEVSPFIESEARKALERVKAWEPVQYITGTARFFGLDISVAPGVLIPRPETAELVQQIVDDWHTRTDLCVLDACTGSGAIAVALARNLPFSTIIGVDISPEALAVAQRNVERLKVAVNLVKADILHWTPDGGKYDIIVSNPPYIDESERSAMLPNVTEYEPEQALFVPDANPLLFYKALAGIGVSALKEDGMIYLEINPRHCDAVKELLIHTGYDDVEAWLDSSGKYRFVKARYASGGDV